MEQEIIKIRETVGKGTRGGDYFYIAEGNELVHINEYAIRRGLGKYDDELVYEVPLNRLSEKVLYRFKFANTGNWHLSKCTGDNFDDDGRLKNIQILDNYDELRHLKFRIKSQTLRGMITQFWQLFIPMINELKEYGRVQNFEIMLAGHQRRLEEAFNNPKKYYFAFMSLPNDGSRIRSLRNTRKWIYQIWVLKLLCEAFKVTKFKSDNSKTWWWVEQGSAISTAIGETSFGDMTFWNEFQPDKSAHMWGMFEEKRLAIRPDIIAVKGHFKYTRDFINSKNAIDIMIECKEGPFNDWKNEIESQILPYQENFRPNNFLIVSLESIPDATKIYLESRGLKVVDDLKLNSETVKTLYDTIWSGFE